MDENSKKYYINIELPYIQLNEISGKLIVIEGTDGVGRTSHIAALKDWLEVKGYGVTITSWAESNLMSQAIQEAKKGHNLNAYTYTLFYLADFADRLEHQIIPALKSGFVVLADRYIYTAFARAATRGVDREWIRQIFGFALKPHAVFYLRIEVKDLIPRVINSHTMYARYCEKGIGEGIDYWESGMDLRMGNDPFESFVNYQQRLIEEFDYMCKIYGFEVIDASRNYPAVHQDLCNSILDIIQRGKQ